MSSSSLFEYLLDETLPASSIVKGLEVELASASASASGLASSAPISASSSASEAKQEQEQGFHGDEDVEMEHITSSSSSSTSSSSPSTKTKTTTSNLTDDLDLDISSVLSIIDQKIHDEFEFEFTPFMLLNAVEGGGDSRAGPRIEIVSAGPGEGAGAGAGTDGLTCVSDPAHDHEEAEVTDSGGIIAGGPSAAKRRKMLKKKEKREEQRAMGLIASVAVASISSERGIDESDSAGEDGASGTGSTTAGKAKHETETETTNVRKKLVSLAGPAPGLFDFPLFSHQKGVKTIRLMISKEEERRRSTVANPRLISPSSEQLITLRTQIASIVLSGEEILANASKVVQDEAWGYGYSARRRIRREGSKGNADADGGVGVGVVGGMMTRKGVGAVGGSELNTIKLLSTTSADSPASIPTSTSAIPSTTSSAVRTSQNRPVMLIERDLSSSLFSVPGYPILAGSASASVSASTNSHLPLPPPPGSHPQTRRNGPLALRSISGEPSPHEPRIGPSPKMSATKRDLELNPLVGDVKGAKKGGKNGQSVRGQKAQLQTTKKKSKKNKTGVTVGIEGEYIPVVPVLGIVDSQVLTESSDQSQAQAQEQVKKEAKEEVARQRRIRRRAIRMGLLPTSITLASASAANRGGSSSLTNPKHPSSSSVSKSARMGRKTTTPPILREQPTFWAPPKVGKNDGAVKLKSKEKENQESVTATVEATSTMGSYAYGYPSSRPGDRERLAPALAAVAKSSTKARRTRIKPVYQRDRMRSGRAGDIIRAEVKKTIAKRKKEASRREKRLLKANGVVDMDAGKMGRKKREKKKSFLQLTLDEGGSRVRYLPARSADVDVAMT